MDATNEIQDVIVQVISHIACTGGGYENWFAGTSPDLETILKLHNISKNKDDWLTFDVLSGEVAAKIRDFFINEMGMDGKSNQNSKQGHCFYTYRKTSHTSP